MSKEDPPSGYGSKHVHYRLNGELIGVSVLDFLPQTVNAVYFFWNTKYAYLNLGIFSALQEILMVKQRSFPLILVQNRACPHRLLGH